MKNYLLFSFVFALIFPVQAQVFNQGVEEVVFKNLMEYGIAYENTGNQSFDSSMHKALQNSWELTSYRILEKNEKPEDTEALLFVTEAARTGEGKQDSKNRKILALMPAEKYRQSSKVAMEMTLAYIYFNGFNDWLKEKDEFRMCHLLLNTLQRGLMIIKDKKLRDNGDLLNERISATIFEDNKSRIGYELIVHRRHIIHHLKESWLKKSKINYRLLTDVEFYRTLEERNHSQYVLFFAKNKFSELSLINSATGEMIYTKHFLGDHPNISKKDFKLLKRYF